LSERFKVQFVEGLKDLSVREYLTEKTDRCDLEIPELIAMAEMAAHKSMCTLYSKNNVEVDREDQHVFLVDQKTNTTKATQQQLNNTNNTEQNLKKVVQNIAQNWTYQKGQEDT